MNFIACKFIVFSLNGKIFCYKSFVNLYLAQQISSRSLRDVIFYEKFGPIHVENPIFREKFDFSPVYPPIFPEKSGIPHVKTLIFCKKFGFLPVEPQIFRKKSPFSPRGSRFFLTKFGKKFVILFFFFFLCALILRTLIGFVGVGRKTIVLYFIFYHLIAWI